ncbi:MAG TPA: phospholipase D-like domain-containing protein [Myxococcales bacterium]|nr:phospholipase D-like domain-containing protein [Myxococcales bacterium]
MPRLLVLLACACLLGCFGRSGAGEFRLDSPAIENAGFDNALFQTVGATFRPGNHVEPVDNGLVFDAAVRIIREARRSVHLETFIWAQGAVSDRIIDAIAKRARDGVACRILVDSVGSPDFGGLQTRLQGLGCDVHRMRPIPGQDDVARDHRKMIIVDGRVAITGGFGIDDKWDGDGVRDDPPQWRDSNLLVRGPAVLDMQQAFAENWEEATGALLPAGDFPPPEDEGGTPAVFVKSKENSIATPDDRLTQLLIASAKRRIWISNAYFVPSTPVMALLTRKAREGVDVRVLAPGEKTDAREYLPSQRARMDQLARDGVRTYEYEPTMMHGKTMMLDDEVVMVGSTNLDALSLNHMDEGALLVKDAHLAAEEARRFLRDLSHSVERVPPERHAIR